MSAKPVLQYEEFPPAKSLADFIECFWTLGGSAEKTIRESLVTGGRVEVIFSDAPFLWYGTNPHARPRAYSGVFVLGQRSRAHYVGFKGTFHFFGIRFRYGCMPLFFKGPADQYSDRVSVISPAQLQAPLPSIRPGPGGDPGTAVRMAEQWLLDSRRAPGEEWHILQNLIREAGSGEEASIRHLSGRHGWSYKKVERVFLRYTGFPPRTLIKLLRFRKALERTETTKDSLTGAAHRLGYFDQSHFIREFHRYTSDKPSSFYKDPPEVAALLYKLRK